MWRVTELSDKTAGYSVTHAPLGTGGLWKHKGWQLPAYIQQVAKGLLRDGKDRSTAIQMAIGAVKRWADGGGNVTPEVRAASAKAIAQWEALRAKAKVNQHSSGSREGAVDLSRGQLDQGHAASNGNRGLLVVAGEESQSARVRPYVVERQGGVGAPSVVRTSVWSCTRGTNPRPLVQQPPLRQPIPHGTRNNAGKHQPGPEPWTRNALPVQPPVQRVEPTGTQSEKRSGAQVPDMLQQTASSSKSEHSRQREAVELVVKRVNQSASTILDDGGSGKGFNITDRQAQDLTGFSTRAKSDYNARRMSGMTHDEAIRRAKGQSVRGM